MSRRKKSAATAEIVLTARALRDLREIELHSVQTWGRKTADKYLDDIAAALDRLRLNPRLLRLEPDFGPGLYFYRVGKHVLVCDDQRGKVNVLTVVHTSMDLPTRLAELEPRLAAEVEILRQKPADDSATDK